MALIAVLDVLGLSDHSNHRDQVGKGPYGCRHGKPIVHYIDDDSAIEILTSKWQRENRLCLRANAIAMLFSNAPAVKPLANAEFVEKRIDVTMSTAAGLNLGSNAVMSLSGPFLLIL